MEKTEDNLALLGQYEATLARLHEPCRAPLLNLLKLQHAQAVTTLLPVPTAPGLFYDFYKMRYFYNYGLA